jgi:hypothetical protein
MIMPLVYRLSKPDVDRKEQLCLETSSLRSTTGSQLHKTRKGYTINKYYEGSSVMQEYILMA